MPGSIKFESPLEKLDTDLIKLVVTAKRNSKGWNIGNADFQLLEDLFKSNKISESEPLLEEVAEFSEVFQYLTNQDGLYQVVERKGRYGSINLSMMDLSILCQNSYTLLKRNKIKVLITHNVPHEVETYVFCKTAQGMGIEIINMRQSLFYWRPYVEIGIDFGEPIDIQINKRTVEEVRPKVEAYAGLKRGEYEKAITGYESLVKKSYENKLWNWNLEFYHAYHSKKNLIVRFLELRNKRKVFNSFVRYSSFTKPEGKFVTVYLHYQPERTTIPQGQIYMQQYVLVHQLRQILPNDVKIIVKEHPTTFRLARRKKTLKFGAKYRDQSFYKNLSALENVVVLNFFDNDFDYIDKALFVVTINGTASVEAVMRSKPTVYFGNAPFKRLPGSFHIKELLNNPDLLDELLEKRVVVRREEVDDFLIEVYRNTYGKDIDNGAYYDVPELENSYRSLLPDLIQYLRKNYFSS